MAIFLAALKRLGEESSGIEIKELNIQLSHDYDLRQFNEIYRAARMASIKVNNIEII